MNPDGSEHDRTGRYWEAVWADREPEAVTWFEATPSTALELITRVTGPHDTVVDIGAGASFLLEHLSGLGYCDLIAVDVSARALDLSRRRLGDTARSITWMVADATEVHLPRPVSLWHDRALFHFLTDPDGRAAYVERLVAGLADGGHLVISTFGPSGPESCSGLPTCRYDGDGLAEQFGSRFDLVECRLHDHPTPDGRTQQFTVALLRLRS